MMINKLATFEDYKIRRIYDEKAEIWYFSVVDIIQALLQQPDLQAARNYLESSEKPSEKRGKRVGYKM